RTPRVVTVRTVPPFPVAAHGARPAGAVLDIRPWLRLVDSRPAGDGRYLLVRVHAGVRPHRRRAAVHRLPAGGAVAVDVVQRSGLRQYASVPARGEAGAVDEDSAHYL